MGDRIVSWFSCGAASAVATKLAIQRAEGREVVVAYCDTRKREHPDNMRFLRDCEKWFGQKVLILGNDEYNRDPDIVFRKTRFLVGPSGARCTAELKRKVRHGFQQPGDIVVLGYTAEEYERRHERTAKAEPFVNFWPILHERGITKDDCLAMLERAGIELPAMYSLATATTTASVALRVRPVTGTKSGSTSLSDLPKWPLSSANSAAPSASASGVIQTARAILSGYR